MEHRRNTDKGANKAKQKHKRNDRSACRPTHCSRPPLQTHTDQTRDDTSRQHNAHVRTRMASVSGKRKTTRLTTSSRKATRGLFPLTSRSSQAVNRWFMTTPFTDLGSIQQYYSLEPLKHTTDPSCLSDPSQFSKEGKRTTRGQRDQPYQEVCCQQFRGLLDFFPTST